MFRLRHSICLFPMLLGTACGDCEETAYSDE
jgi:hypothetical protein